MGPPKLLIDTFKMAGEKRAEDVTVLLEEDGFDAETMRVLVAWQYTPHEWKAPRRPCPDGGNPTAAAWAWMWSGITLDYAAIADAANVSRGTARARITMLIATRLVFPDNTIAKSAKGALTAAVQSRLPKKEKKEKEPSPAAARNPGTGIN